MSFQSTNHGIEALYRTHSFEFPSNKNRNKRLKTQEKIQ
jgi:hypothetical protein